MDCQFIASCEKGDIDGAEQLIEKIRISGNKQIRATVILWASHNGYLEIVKFLVTGYKNKTSFLESMLYAAVLSGKLEIVEILSSRGLYITNKYIDCASERGYFDIVKYFVETHNCDVVHNYNAVKYACENGHFEIVKYLIEKGSSSIFLFSIACSKGHHLILEYIISLYGIPLLVKSHLIRACINDHLSIVTCLLDRNITLLEGDIKKISEKGSYEIVNYIVKKLNINQEHLSERYKTYTLFCQKMKNKNRIRAQKKIYFWWIQICYDITKPCGKRMAHHNLLSFLALK